MKRLTAFFFVFLISSYFFLVELDFTSNIYYRGTHYKDNIISKLALPEPIITPARNQISLDRLALELVILLPISAPEKSS